MSRLPIREAVEVEYHSCLRFDCTARKGALLGRVRVDAAHDVDVWVTHLQAGDDAEGEAVRVAQLEELGAYVSQYDIGNPIIFLGDFNSEPGGQAHAQMVRLLSRRDAWVEWVERQASAALGHTFSADNVWNPGIRSQRIDYVLLRAGRAFDWQVGGAALAFSQPIGGRHLSDHFGVSAVLALQRVLAAR